jgi:hypothetical protein
MGQGYLFSRPIDSDSVERMLEDGANVFSDDLAPTYQTGMIELADLQ